MAPAVSGGSTSRGGLEEVASGATASVLGIAELNPRAAW